MFTLSSQGSSKSIEYEKIDIRQRMNQFIQYCRTGRYQQAYQLTSGKEKKIFAGIVKALKRNNGVPSKDLQEYFNRLKDYSIDAIEIKNNRSVVICTFSFRFFDSTSYDEIRKDREVYYYLVKENNKWYISFSKLVGEKYFYRSKTSKKWNRKY